jgi:TRAP-type C4-dicarboxylate transport system permease small subunit
MVMPNEALYAMMVVVDIIILLLCLSVIPFGWPYFPIFISLGLWVGAYFAMNEIEKKLK